MMMTMMKFAFSSFLLLLATTTSALEVAYSSVRGLKTGDGSPEVSAGGGMEENSVKMKMMKTKKRATSGKKAGVNASGKKAGMKAGGKMMGNGGMKAKKGMEPKTHYGID
jgi:hypothetical protein